MEITQSNFESITTDFNDLKIKININSQDIKKYLCAVVENNKKYYILFSTESTNGSGWTTFGLFEKSTNSSMLYSIIKDKKVCLQCLQIVLVYKI